MALGFALETEDLLANARRKLKEKGFTLIAANSAVGGRGRLRRGHEPGNHSGHSRAGWKSFPSFPKTRWRRSSWIASLHLLQDGSVTGPGALPGQVARYLRQQGELGGTEFFLGDLHPRCRLWRLAGSPGKPDRTRSRPRAKAAIAQGSTWRSREEALACRRCALARTRTNVVFSDGNP